MAIQNKVVKVFETDGTWTAPAGVTSISVQPYWFNGPDIQVADMGWTSMMLNWDGTCYTSGQAATGELGNSTTANVSLPTVVSGVQFSQVFGGMRTMAGLDPLGNAWTWGSSPQGQLGDSTIVAKSSPVLVVGGLKFKKLAVCGYPVSSHLLGLTVTGSLYAWGYNGNGQLGDGTVTNRSSPVQVQGGITDWVDIANCAIYPGANGASLALRSNGAAYGWGINTNGELGDGTVTTRSSPVLVVGSISATRIHGCMMMTAAGAVYGWGPNTKGEIGDGTTTNRSSPVQVVGGLVATQIAASTIATAAGRVFSKALLDSSGNIYTWGFNAKGQLGDGTLVSKSSPVLVSGSKSWVAVYGGHALEDDTVGGGVFAAIDTASQLWGWGFNGAATVGGSFGTGSTVATSSPVMIYGADKLSLAYGLKDQTPQQFTVVPGTTYSIVVDSSVATFNGTVVGTIPKGVRLVY